MAYNWPGNVREMENVLQQTLLLSPFAVDPSGKFTGAFSATKRK